MIDSSTQSGSPACGSGDLRSGHGQRCGAAGGQGRQVEQHLLYNTQGLWLGGLAAQTSVPDAAAAGLAGSQAATVHMSSRRSPFCLRLVLSLVFFLSTYLLLFGCVDTQSLYGCAHVL